MATLPGDPREDMNIILGCDGVCGLEENGMLHMNLYDFILHSTCMHYTDANEINYCHGGTIIRQLFPRWLIPITNPNADQKFDKKCTTFNGFNRGKHRFIIPYIDEAHYNVIDVMIDNTSKNFITKGCFYDSMVSPTAVGKKKRIIPAHIKEFIANLVGVLNKLCLKPKRKCSCQLKKVLQHIVQIGCPTQMNGIGCGLFAVMNCLHIFLGVAINPLILKKILLDSARFFLTCWVMRKRQQDSIYAVYFHGYKLLFPKIYHWMSF